MLYVLRHLVSVLLLPVTVAVLVPIWIARRYGVAVDIPNSLAGGTAAIAGIVLGALGLALFGASLGRFASDGRGTLAPWDPPRRLVVRGPYRLVRNPMISGVLLVLAGIAIALRSWPHAAWTGIFALLNLIFITLVEEPRLEARFGGEYRAYRRAVPRFLPRRGRWPPDRA